MRKTSLTILGFLVLLAAFGQPAVAAENRQRNPEWISQKTIDAEGGYKLRVRGLGTFMVERVRPANSSHATCLVHVPSIREAISQGVEQRTLDFSSATPVTIELKVRTCKKKGFADIPVLSDEDSDSGGGGGEEGEDDEGDDEEVVCCKGGGSGCIADISRLP